MKTETKVTHDLDCICSKCIQVKIMGKKTVHEAVVLTCGCKNMIGGEIVFCPLHAAAPELLEACKEISQLLSMAKEERFLEVHKNLISAISKAEAV